MPSQRSELQSTTESFAGGFEARISAAAASVDASVFAHEIGLDTGREIGVGSAAPAFAAKGHLGIGADADITVIDPDRVTDQATYIDSTRPSIGIDYVLVSGEFVVREGDIVIDAYPGRGLRGQLR